MTSTCVGQGRFALLEQKLASVVGDRGLVTSSAEMEPYLTDWTRTWRGQARAVVRPRDTGEVSEVVRLCQTHGVAMVPQGGRTGVCGGATPDAGMIVVSLERMRVVDPPNRVNGTVKVQAGATLQAVNDALECDDLILPIEIGARGSCTIGGLLATNAGGFNALRHGSARALCLGLEAVLPSGQIMNLMSELRKDNTGYALRDLMIGSEGTLGIITGAVLMLHPRALSRATAFVACRDLEAALDLLGRLRQARGGMLEAFELLPEDAVSLIRKHFPDLRAPLATSARWGVLAELASSADGDAAPGPSGRTPITQLLETELAKALEEGLVTDASIAASEAARRDMWRLREASLEATTREGHWLRFDIALPLDRLGAFLELAQEQLEHSCPNVRINYLGHLGDGNLHYSVMPRARTDDLTGRTTEEIASTCETTVLNLLTELGGSFSAEHGIGRSKPHVMVARKDPGALAAMQAIKAALDPEGLMNPGVIFPSVPGRPK